MLSLKSSYTLACLATFALGIFGCAEPEEQGLLVFGSSRSGNGDIYLATADSAQPKILVGTQGPEGSPRFDPAMTRLIHTVFDTTGSYIYADDQQLFKGPMEEFAPVWSATGRIAYVGSSAGSVDVFIADSDYSNLQSVTSDTLIERYPAWHPNGDKLIYAKLLQSGWDLFELSLPQGEESQLTFDGVYIGHPEWAPSGEEVVMDRWYGEQTEIAVLNLSTGEIRRLTNNLENDLVPAWSLDGKLIAFAGVRDGNWDVWTIPASGGEPTRVTVDPAFDGGPIFVPSAAVE